MSGAVLARVTLKSLSGLARDNVVNTFCFITADEVPLALDYEKVRDAIEDFYNGGAATNSSVRGYINNNISRAANACEIACYNLGPHLDGTPIGSPEFTYFFTLDVSLGGAPLPSEVACCVSFNADYGATLEHVGTTRPKSRRRGRLYIGPLTDNAKSAVAPEYRSAVAVDCRDTLAMAARRLIDQEVTGPNVNWAVWSRRDATARAVAAAFVDDAFDTQRSRGQKAIVRSVA